MPSGQLTWGVGRARPGEVRLRVSSVASLSPFVVSGALQPQSVHLLTDTATPARRTVAGNK